MCLFSKRLERGHFVWPLQRVARGAVGVLQHVKSKKLVALAVTSLKRQPFLPDTPAVAELAPGLMHPVAGERIDELWRRFDQGAHRLTPVSLEGAG